MDSLLIGLLVAVVTWLVLRQRKAKEMRRRPPPEPAPTTPSKTMPRIGTPGSVTKDQLRKLKEFHFQPSRAWSKEEADLILDSVVYLRAAIRQVTGEQDAPEDVQNTILTFILSDDRLREYIIRWGGEQRDRGIVEAPGKLSRNEHFERVAEFIREVHAGARPA